MKHEVTTYQTKSLLSQTLKSLMRHKPFSKITVNEIIRECGINRKTFYYHFQDIYDLLQWTLTEEALQVVNHFDLLSDYEAAIRFVMDYVEQNDYIISCAYDSMGREEMKRFFYQDFICTVTSAIEQAEEASAFQLDRNFKDYAARFYSEAIAGMLLEWAKNHKQQNREETIQYLTAIIGSAIRSLQNNLIP